MLASKVIWYKHMLSNSIKDILSGAGRWRLWTALTWEDIKTTYRRSIVGVAWVSLSFATFVAVKILIFGSMFGGGSDKYYGAYLLIGFFAWQFMSQIVVTATSVFTRSENWITNDPLPLSVFVYQNVCRSLFDFALTGLIVLGGLAYLGFGWHHYSWLALPALALYTLNAFWITMLLGLLCTRFRDFQHLTSTTMRVLFFVTPIFWLPAQLGEQTMSILWWNPFSQFIWILRTPILDQSFVPENWAYVGAITAIGWVVTILLYSLFRRRIVFWF